jgi:hypothetical protein
MNEPPSRENEEAIKGETVAQRDRDAIYRIGRLGDNKQCYSADAVFRKVAALARQQPAQKPQEWEYRDILGMFHVTCDGHTLFVVENQRAAAQACAAHNASTQTRCADSEGEVK